MRSIPSDLSLLWLKNRKIKFTVTKKISHILRPTTVNKLDNTMFLNMNCFLFKVTRKSYKCCL